MTFWYALTISVILITFSSESVSSTIKNSDSRLISSIKAQLEINASNPLKIAVINNDPPMNMLLPSGDPTGYSVELWGLWSKINDVPIRFVSGSYFENIDALKNGKVDLQGGLFRNTERQSWADFSMPITEITTSIFFSDDYQGKKQLDALNGRRVAVGKGSHQETLLRKKYPDIEVVTFLEVEEVINKLFDGEIAAIISENAYMSFKLGSLGLPNVLEKGKEVFAINTVHGLVTKGSRELLQLIDVGLSRIPIEQLTKIEARWFSNRPPYYSELQHKQVPSLTMSEILWLEAHKTLRFSVSPNLPPFETVSLVEEYQGISADYLKILSHILGIDFLLVEGLSWTEVLAAAKLKRIDLIPTVVKTEAREKFLSFTEPYLKFPLVIATNKTADIIQSLTDLDGLKVGAEESTPAEYYIKENYPQIKLVLFKSAKPGLQALENGDINGFVHNAAVIVHQKRFGDFEDIGIAAFLDYQLEMSMGVRKGMEPLISILNKALDSIDEKKRIEIANRWLGLELNFSQEIYTALYWGILAISSLLLISFFVRRVNRNLQREITKRKRTEEQLVLARVDAEKASKVKDEFLANMTHEIRTPMNGVVGMSEVLLQTSLDDNQVQYLKSLSHSSNRLLTLINQILDLSKIEAGKMELEFIDFNFSKMIDDLKNQAGFGIGNKSVNHKTVIDDSIPEILVGDHYRLTQVLVNLISNAIKFTEKGKIQLDIVKNKISENEVELLFVVEDSGIGMTPDQVSTLFSTYNQVDSTSTRRYHGAGIGFSICEKLCELMKGKLQVESQLGRGSKFSFTARFGLKDTGMHEDDLIATYIKQLTGKRVLVVDDNVTNRTVAKKILERIGAKVKLVESGGECLDCLKSADFDVVLMDIQMPGMTGLDVSELIRIGIRNQNIPIIAVSGNTMVSDIKKSKAAGMNAHLGKPINSNLLYKTMVECLSNC